MTPKGRLTFWITALSGAITITVATLALYWLADARLRQVSEIARLSAESVKSYVLERVSEKAVLPPGAGMEEARMVWRQTARDDPQLTDFLVSTLAASPSLVEILITSSGEVLASSNPASVGGEVPEAAELKEWSAAPPWQKLRELLSPAHDLEIRIPLAASGSAEPVFVIRARVSTALVRAAVMPSLWSLLLVSVLSIVAAALLAGVLASIAGRPLARVSEFIDLVAEGKTAGELSPVSGDSELAAMQSKLTLLGERARSARQVDQMIDRLQDAVLLFDGGGKLALASRASDRFLAGARWELIGKPLDRVFPETTPLGALLVRSMRLGRSFRDHVIEAEERSGAVRATSVSLDILTDFPDRRPLGAVVTLRDAVSHRELETEIDSSFRREALGRLLQGVAHEIKNPLNSIYTHLQLLQLEMSDRAPEASRELDIIAREIKTLDRMVVTLLDFTRPLELRREETDLEELAGEIVSLVRPQAKAKGVSLEIDSDGPARVSADRGLLRQALLNVVTNAVECMSDPGAVRVALGREPGAVTLSVSDQGPGVPEKIREKIFNLYFTTKGKRGSGIGLAMSKRIAQLHGGDLELESTLGSGSAFRFRFPAP